MALIRLPYGIGETRDLVIEDRNLVLHADREFPGETADLGQAVLDALDKPVQGASFSERLEKAGKVLILVDNWARLTPAHKILPPILEKIRRQGKKAEILVSNGLLREMTETELRRKFGDAILSSGIPIYQNKARETWDYGFVGVTSYGTPISMHRRLMEADLSLSVTMTQATLWGFGGGGSMVLPGVCTAESIEWNHRLMTCPTCAVGYDAPLNRMREDIEEATRMSGLDMSLLVILNPHLEVIHVAAGETIAAHRASVQKYKEYYSIDMATLPPGKLDVGISGSFPGDRFFAHACWPIANLDPFVRDGGTIVLACKVEGGLAHFTYAKDYVPYTVEARRRLFEDIFYGKQGLWHACLWMPIIEVMAKKEVIVVTEPERVPDFERVKIPAVTSLEEAFERTKAAYGKDLKAGAFPYGKWVVPDQVPLRESRG